MLSALLRRPRVLLASYIVSARVQADWWQPQYRDEVYRRAKARLAAAVAAQDDDEDDGVGGSNSNNTRRRDGGSDAASRAARIAAAAAASLSQTDDEALYGVSTTRGSGGDEDDDEDAGDADVEGATTTTTATSSDDGAVDETVRAAAASRRRDSARRRLSLHEANALLATFVTHHDGESASAVLQYVRDCLHERLRPFHYHALLRIFATQRDKDSALQLLDLMTTLQRQHEHGGNNDSDATDDNNNDNNSDDKNDSTDDVVTAPSLVTLETYARVLDCLHCLAPHDVLSRVLQLCDAAERACGTHVYAAEEGSEEDTAASLARVAHDDKTADDDADDKGSSSSSQPAMTTPRPCGYCPVLRSLLHHVSQHIEGGPVAAMLVVVWMRALGVALRDWDYVLLLHALLSRRAAFPLVRALFASVGGGRDGGGGGGAVGCVTPHAVLERVLGSDYATATSATAGAVANNGSNSSSSEQTATSPHASVALHMPPSARRVAAAMCASLQRAGVDVHATVHVGVVNTQTFTLDALVDRVLTLAEATAATSNYNNNKSSSSSNKDSDASACSYNVAVLHHTLTLLYSALHDATSAVHMLRRAADVEARLSAQLHRAHDGQSTDSAMTTTTTTTRPVMRVCLHHLVDTALLLPTVSARTAAAVLPVYEARVPQLQQRLAAARAQYRRASMSKDDNSSNSSNNNISATTAAATTTVSTLSSTTRVVESLWGEATVPSTMNASTCAGVLTRHLRGNAAARAALRQAVESVQAGAPRLSSTSRARFRHVAALCSRHPRRNSKLTATGLAERRRWGDYLDARDTALALFGSTRQARDSMKHLFYNGNRLPELRSPAMVTKDMADVCQLLWPHARPCIDGSSSDGGNDDGSNGSDAASAQAQLSYRRLAQSLRQRRTTLPRLHCAAEVVPRYLWDVTVYNPYPHILLPQQDNGSGNNNHHHQQQQQQSDDGDDITDDVFADLWRALMDRRSMRDTTWYLRNTEMYMLLMRNLLYRLDWEAAVHLTTRMLEHATYTYQMDSELHSIFRTVGDPAGFLAFKVATRLFDGRIIHNSVDSATTHARTATHDGTTTAAAVAGGGEG